MWGTSRRSTARSTHAGYLTVSRTGSMPVQESCGTDENPRIGGDTGVVMVGGKRVVPVPPV